MKAYLGVYFNNKSSWDIIPKRWLITNEEKLQCYWPPKDAGDLQTLARNSCAPKKHWEVYDINKIETSSGKYFLHNNLPVNQLYDFKTNDSSSSMLVIYLTISSYIILTYH